jgi:hypothetical protein
MVREVPQRFDVEIPNESSSSQDKVNPKACMHSKPLRPEKR